MKFDARMLFATTATALMSSSLLASTLSLKLTLPTIQAKGVRPPTRPYVAVWVRSADNGFVSNLAVWYQIEDHHGRRGGMGDGAEAARGRPPWSAEDGAGPGAGLDHRPEFEGRDERNGESGIPAVRSENTPGGARWMNGVREWWADSGHALKFPVDGLTSASRPAGAYELTFDSADPKLAGLKPGKYQLMIEAAREHGGEETISIPFVWPVRALQAGETSGKTELGAAQLRLTP
jgi:hypothetical protein